MKISKSILTDSFISFFLFSSFATAQAASTGGGGPVKCCGGDPWGCLTAPTMSATCTSDHPACRTSIDCSDVTSGKSQSHVTSSGNNQIGTSGISSPIPKASSK